MTLNPADVAAYLAEHPDFFQHYAQLLADISLVSPHGGRAVSLQERQMEMLRDKIKVLELRLADLVRFGQENDAITEKTVQLAGALFKERNAALLPDVLAVELKNIFALPNVALRLWNLAIGTDQPYAQNISKDVRLFANSLQAPYVGPNSGFDAVNWLNSSETISSLALVPLHHGESAYGLLVLGSGDPERFTAAMGTTYLSRIGEIASAALARLLR